jgi:hypothetical protein
MKSAIAVIMVIGLCACASTGNKAGAQFASAAMPAAPAAVVPAVVTVAPENGYMAVAEERVYSSLSLAWSKAELSAAHNLCKQQMSSFIGAVMREAAEKPVLNGNNDLQVFLKDWSSTVEMQTCKNPQLTYARLWDSENNKRWKENDINGKTYELVKVTVVIGPAQIASLKAFSADLASAMKHDAVARHVLKQGQDDFFKVLKKVQNAAQASDTATVAEAETGASDEEESPQ